MVKRSSNEFGENLKNGYRIEIVIVGVIGILPDHFHYSVDCGSSGPNI